jgi:hypothetical protein
MNRREETIKLSKENSELHNKVVNYLLTHLHPGFSHHFTLEKLLPPSNDTPAALTHFIGLCFEGNPVYHSTVDREWYNNLKKIGLPYSVFLNLPIKR